LGALGLHFGVRQGRQQQGGQNGDDRDDHQKLNQSETDDTFYSASYFCFHSFNLRLRQICTLPAAKSTKNFQNKLNTAHLTY
jgi:hypothetical protein